MFAHVYDEEAQPLKTLPTNVTVECFATEFKGNDIVLIVRVYLFPVISEMHFQAAQGRE